MRAAAVMAAIKGMSMSISQKLMETSAITTRMRMGNRAMAAIKGMSMSISQKLMETSAITTRMRMGNRAMGIDGSFRACISVLTNDSHGGGYVWSFRVMEL